MGGPDRENHTDEGNGARLVRDFPLDRRLSLFVWSVGYEPG